MTLIDALIEVETEGIPPEKKDMAIGDNGNAFGCLQIWDVYMIDAFPLSGLKGKDCLGNRELSIKAFHAYMKRYATEKRLGRPVTDEDIARIHNLGPNGWRASGARKKAGDVYWAKVRKHLS